MLRDNDLGAWTRPAPRLYPHQWSWDSAFIAIGLAHVDPSRALRELESLFAGQWADGRVPHIVYNPAAPADAYFPDAARWACADLSAAAPEVPVTSGICQPPVHSLAVWKICSSFQDVDPLLPRLRALYRRLFDWHRYLATARDPQASGLLTIYHPWESGTDNSPRWDAPLSRVDVGPVPPYARRDLQHVLDPSQRPTDAEYDRYLWLVESLKNARYDDGIVHRTHPFRVKDVLFSAIFAAASEALANLAEVCQASDEEQREIATWLSRSSAAVSGQWDATDGLALDLDACLGEPIRVTTLAGLAPLLCPGLSDDLAQRLVEELRGPRFSGADGLRFQAVPSTSPGTEGFHPRTYWRGPIWPFANWLLWWGLRERGYGEAAAALRQASLALLSQPDVDFPEYFEPFTGQPLGSAHQAWTAAVTLDWLASAS